jgi:hypothetical protein
LNQNWKSLQNGKQIKNRGTKSTNKNKIRTVIIFRFVGIVIFNFNFTSLCMLLFNGEEIVQGMKEHT